MGHEVLQLERLGPSMGERLPEGAFSKCDGPRQIRSAWMSSSKRSKCWLSRSELARLGCLFFVVFDWLTDERRLAIARQKNKTYPRFPQMVIKRACTEHLT